MHIPISGIVFLPLVASVFLFWPSRLEELLIYTAVFQGAAVLNLGGGFTFGLSPYFFTAMLLSARVGLKWNGGRIQFAKDEFVQKHLRLVAVFIAWCVMSALVLPFLFEGILVDSPRAGAEAVFYLALPLHWSFSNAGQAGYMVLNFFVVLALADFCTRRPLKKLIDALTYSGVIVLFVGAYQMLASRIGLPFPASFFNSNGTWGQNYNQMIGAGWHRVSATFVEPSDAGGFLSCWLLFELILANWGVVNRTRHWIFGIVGCVILFATTSSTGYMTLAVILMLAVGRVVLEAVRHGRLMIRSGLITLTVVLIGVSFLTIGNGSSLLDAVLWNKSGSSSAVHRFATVSRAVSVMQETYGLGSGLGSNRAFGTFAYIGSNLGIVGLLSFLYMLAHLLKNVSVGLKSPSRDVDDRVSMIACMSAFSANLISLAISGAEISNPRIWVLWGILLASMRNHGGAVALQYGRAPRLETHLSS